MKVDNNFEFEINQIRLAVYEKTKDMTPAELSEYYKKSTETAIQAYGFRTVTKTA